MQPRFEQLPHVMTAIDNPSKTDFFFVRNMIGLLPMGSTRLFFGDGHMKKSVRAMYGLCGLSLTL